MDWQTKRNTNFIIEHLLLLVASRLHNLEDRLEEPEIAESPRLIVELLPLGILGDADKDVGGGILEQVEEGVVLGFSPQC